MRSKDVAFFMCVLWLFGLWGFVSGQNLPQTYTWSQAVDQSLTDMKTLSSGCALWIEEYTVSGSSGNFRSWKRCGLNAQPSGASVDVITLSDTATQGGNCSGGVSAVRIFVSGTGFATGGYLIQPGESWPSGFHYTETESCQDGRAQTATGVNNRYVSSVSCVGGLSGSFQNVNDVISTSGGTLKAVVPSNFNCASGDSLVRDFGPVSSNCNFNATVQASFAGGRKLVGPESCVPLRYAATSCEAGSCVFEPVTGDPVTVMLQQFPSDLGQVVTGSGGDTASAGRLAIMGDSGTGNGSGMAPSYSGQSSTGSVGTGGGVLTGGGVGGGSIGSAPGGGLSPGDIKKALEDAEVGASSPSLPSFDSTLVSPVEADWVGRVQSFISSSPFASILGGSGISTSSGACSVSGGFFYGQPISLNFCNPSPAYSLLSALGVVILALATLASLYIAFGV